MRPVPTSTIASRRRKERGKEKRRVCESKIDQVFMFEEIVGSSQSSLLQFNRGQFEWDAVRYASAESHRAFPGHADPPVGQTMNRQLQNEDERNTQMQRTYKAVEVSATRRSSRGRTADL